MRASHSIRTGQAAALLAMLLFAVAVVRSNLMQVAMALPATPMCGTMADMPAGAASGEHHRHRSPQAPDRSCAFCDAAAHLPLLATALTVPVPQPRAWLPARPNPLAGPRGPPAFRPHARGPPALLIA